jgi:hypothetical protein
MVAGAERRFFKRQRRNEMMGILPFKPMAYNVFVFTIIEVE